MIHLLLVLVMGSAHAIGVDEQVRAAFIGGGLSGWIQSSGEQSPPVLREIRFRFDGEAYRLSIAGLKPIRFLPNTYGVMHFRDPHGPWVNLGLMWEDPGLRLTLVFRSNESLEHTTKTAFKGQLASVPRALITVVRYVDGEQIARGVLASLDQDPKVVREQLDYIGPAIKYVSFESADARSCADVIEKSRIRVRQ